MSIIPVQSSKLSFIKNDKGAITILYNDPDMCDEELLYTFNKDGSASCVSTAWGHTLSSVPKDTFHFKDGTSAQKMVRHYEFNQLIRTLLGKNKN